MCSKGVQNVKSIIFGVILLVATPSLVYSNTLTYKEGDASPEAKEFVRPYGIKSIIRGMLRKRQHSLPEILEPYLPPRGEEYYLDPPKMLPKDKVRLA